MNKTNLAKFDNQWYQPGSIIKRLFWYFINFIFFKSSWNLSNSLKCFLLRIFGAKIGKNVIIKPNVNIKYPWFLVIGDCTWIGEEVWIDNLSQITIGANCCISQGAMLLCGNHNYKKITFDLMVGNIVIEDGVWIGAQAVVCPNVVCCSHSVLTVGSIATKKMHAYQIYTGNPAVKIKERVINT